MINILTLSGNEITDSSRINAAEWPTTQQGGSTDGAAAPGGGFGIWEAGMNLFRRGQCDATTDWNPDGMGSNAVRIDATTAAPFSPQSIKDVTGGTAAGEGIDATSDVGQAVAAGVTGVGSIWFKGVAGQPYKTFVFWANTDATFTSGANSIFIATGGWQLLTPPAVAVAAGKTGDALRIRVATNTQRAESFWVAHAMLQKGVNVVSPYIATSGGATATRAAALVTAPTDLLSVTQGWIALLVEPGWSSGSEPNNFPTLFTWWDGSNNNKISLYRNKAAANWTLETDAGGAGAGSISIAGSGEAGAPIPLVAYWTPTQVGLSINGGAFTTYARSAIPTGLQSVFSIGSNPNGGNFIDSDILWFACGTGTLTNADAATIGAINIGSNPVYAYFPSSAQLTGTFPRGGVGSLQNPIEI